MGRVAGSRGMAWLRIVSPGCPVARSVCLADTPPLGTTRPKAASFTGFGSFIYFSVLPSLKYLIYSYNWPLSLFPQPAS